MEDDIEMALLFESFLTRAQSEIELSLSESVQYLLFHATVLPDH